MVRVLLRSIGAFELRVEKKRYLTITQRFSWNFLRHGTIHEGYSRAEAGNKIRYSRTCEGTHEHTTRGTKINRRKGDALETGWGKQLSASRSKTQSRLTLRFSRADTTSDFLNWNRENRPWSHGFIKVFNQTACEKPDKTFGGLWIDRLILLYISERDQLNLKMLKVQEIEQKEAGTVQLITIS